MFGRHLCRNSLFLFHCFAQILAVSLSCTQVLAVYTGKKADESTRYLVLPTQNGTGGQGIVRNHVINPASPVQVTFLNSIKSKADLGQEFGEKALRKVIGHHLSLSDSERYVIHASGVGTATALNYVSHHPERISAMILESVMGTANGAIYRAFKESVSSKLASLCGYYWLPFCYKMVVPPYSPIGEQPIFSLDRIPTHIPIVILQSLRDPLSSIDDAMAVYYGLRKTGNENIYLIYVDSEAHVELLEGAESGKEVRAINQIFRNHELPFHEGLLKELGDVDLREFQPNCGPLKKSYEGLVSQENTLRKMVEFGKVAIPTAIVGGVLYYCTGY